jgi:hypothetical protein
MEQVYQHLTGMKFRQRVEAVIEKFNDMREDLERERRFMASSGQSERRRSWRLSTLRSEWWATCRVSPASPCPRFPASTCSCLRRQPIRKRK